MVDIEVTFFVPLMSAVLDDWDVFLIRCRFTGGKRMKKAILATKVGMTQIFDENGTLVPVTVLQAGPCVVTQVKTVKTMDTVQYRLVLLISVKSL